MYEEFYGLREKPFSIQPDPDFLFLTRRHGLAYSMMEYSVHNRAALSVICGEIGCGKTTLIQHLINQLGADVTVGVINNTHPDIANLLEWIMLAFGLPYEGLSQVSCYAKFQQFLVSEYNAGRRVLLVVDEAQNLTPAALESLRMLSNINVGKDQLLQIMLVGQPQLRDLLQRPELRQVAQRVSAHFFIPPLEPPEVERYIRARLRHAGREAPLFTLKACARIAEASKGIPRSINILCDTALVYGFSAGLEWIDDEVIDEVLQDQLEFGALPALELQD